MIADAQHLRTVGNFSATLSEEMILPYLWTASERLRTWVSDAVYEAAETFVETELTDSPRDFSNGFDENDDADEVRRARALANAEAMLALALGIASFNTVFQTAGKAGGISVSGSIAEDQFQYLTPGQVRDAEKSYMAKAELAAKKYLVEQSGVNPGPGVSHAIDNQGDPMDSNCPESVLGDGLDDIADLTI